MTKPKPKLEARIRILTKLMHATPTGINVHRAAARLKVSTDTAGDVMGVMRDRGLAQCRRSDRSAIWFLMVHADVALATLDAIKAERRRISGKYKRRHMDETLFAKGDKPNAMQARVIARVIEAVGEEGGDVYEMARRFGVSRNRANILLTVAHQFGEVAKVRRSTSIVWMLASLAPAWVEPEKDQEPELPVTDPHPFVHRRADAFSPLPFVCTAAASVFHLGMAA